MDGPEGRGPERGQEAARPWTWPWSPLSSPEAGRTHTVGSGPGRGPQQSRCTVSCVLQNPPGSAGKATRPLNCAGSGLLAGQGPGRRMCGQPLGRVWGFLSSVLDRHVPGVPSCEVRRRADAASAAPRRLQRKPLAEGGKCHWGRTIRPLVIPGAGVTGACPKSLSSRD